MDKIVFLRSIFITVYKPNNIFSINIKDSSLLLLFDEIKISFYKSTLLKNMSYLKEGKNILS